MKRQRFVIRNGEVVEVPVPPDEPEGHRECHCPVCAPARTAALHSDIARLGESAVIDLRKPAGVYL